MFELSVRMHFSAAHRLRGHKGACARQHGHNWAVEITIRGRKLDKLGMLVDFSELKLAAKAAIDRLDHCDLNELPEFRKRNPTSEQIARRLFEALAAAFDRPGRRVACVRVSETEGTSAAYRSGARA